MAIRQGTLWTRLRETTEQAIKSGALVPVPTNVSYIEEQGIRYQVRVLESLKRKDEAGKAQAAAAGSGRRPNPFLPPDPELTVGDVTDTHVAVLNKFNVLENHLLIITRDFEEQEMLLTRRDFEALWICLPEYPSLGFYNGGHEAGASQQHKHLQVVPLPLSPEGPPVPLEPLIQEATSGAGLSRVPAFPFLHCCGGLRGGESSQDAAQEAYSLYASMLRAVGMTPPEDSRGLKQSRPYCLLMTRTWMLLVPRTKEYHDGISLNSLAFVGSFFVRDEEQLERLRAGGVMNALRTVTAGA